MNIFVDDVIQSYSEIRDAIPQRNCLYVEDRPVNAYAKLAVRSILYNV